MGVKRADNRKLDEIRVEVGVKESLKKKLVTRRLIWVGHVERIGDEKPAECRCPESGGKKEERKTRIAMEIALKVT